MKKEIFFDSWGDPWASCEPNDVGARAFGPTGIARPVNPEAIGFESDPMELGEWNHPSPAAQADAVGRFIPADGPDGWPTLAAD